jgi:hypothetical protein
MQKLLFIDTNIWLDFYRTRNETGLSLLKHVESVSQRIIATYQLETEFKSNRQAAIVEGFNSLKAPDAVPRPGIFSDAKASALMTRQHDETKKRVREMKARLVRVLRDPTKNDPVYQACQRIFRRNDALVLTRDNLERHQVRRRAFRRFLHGCPPRKRSDTSIGDALNWEWMVRCAIKQSAELVIVTRDSDYGVTVDGASYINDHLKQEFSERVSQKRKVLLYAKLSDALKHFQVPVTREESEDEDALVKQMEAISPQAVQVPSGIRSMSDLDIFLRNRGSIFD